MYAYFWVFIGGGLGSICRYGIAHALSSHELRFPWATFLANALACMVLGLLVGLSLNNQIPQARYRLMLMTGFCGGFSTFSTFSNETFLLFESGQYFYALSNILASLLVCLGGIYLGIKLVH